MKWGALAVLVGVLNSNPVDRNRTINFERVPTSVDEFLHAPTSQETRFKIAIYSPGRGFQTSRPEVPRYDSLGVKGAESYFFNDRATAIRLEGGLSLPVETAYFAFNGAGQPLIQQDGGASDVYYLSRHWQSLEMLRTDLLSGNFRVGIPSERKTLESCLLRLQRRTFTSESELVQAYNHGKRSTGCTMAEHPLTQGDWSCMAKQASGCRFMGPPEIESRFLITPSSPFTLLDLMLQLGVTRTAHAPFKVMGDNVVAINNF